MKTSYGSEFVNREIELINLKGLLKQTMTEGIRSCFITGESGTGKSWLVQQFIRQAKSNDQTLMVAWGNCVPGIGESSPYLPFRKILADLLGASAVQSEMASNAARLKATAKTTANALIELAPGLVGIFLPYAAFGIELARYAARESGILKKLDEHNRREDRYEAETKEKLIPLNYATLLSRIAEDAPLVLVIDDMQWIDEHSAALVFQVMRHCANAQIMVIGIFRSNELYENDSLVRHPLRKLINELGRASFIIDLDKISRDRIESFVSLFLDTIPNSLRVDFRDSLYRHTRGNPFYCRELLNYFLQNGSLRFGSTGRLEIHDEIQWNTIPPTIEVLIEERVAQLPPQHRRILEIACVEGVEFTGQTLTDIIDDIPPEDMIRYLSQDLYLRFRFIEDLGPVNIAAIPINRYRFVHSSIHDYLYSTLAPSYRAVLHGKVAESLRRTFDAREEVIARELAEHYERSGRYEIAEEFLEKAAEQAYKLGAFGESGLIFDRALHCLEHVHMDKKNDRHYRHAEARLLFGRGRAAYGFGNLQSGEIDYVESLRLAETVLDVELQIEILCELSDLELKIKQESKAKRYAEQAVRLSNQSSSALSKTKSRRRLSIVRRSIELDFDGSMELLREAIDIAREAGLQNQESLGLNSMAAAYASIGQYRKALTFYDDALSLAQLDSDEYIEQMILRNKAMSLKNLGEVEQSLAIYERSLDYLTRTKGQVGVVHCLSGMANLYMINRELDKALSYLHKALRLAQENQDRRMTNTIVLDMAAVYLFVGNIQTSRQLLTMVSFEETPVRFRAFAAMLFGYICAHDANLTEAKLWFERAIETVDNVLNGSPEDQFQRFRKVLAEIAMCLVSVDETHCSVARKDLAEVMSRSRDNRGILNRFFLEIKLLRSWDVHDRTVEFYEAFERVLSEPTGT